MDEKDVGSLSIAHRSRDHRPAAVPGRPGTGKKVEISGLVARG